MCSIHFFLFPLSSFLIVASPPIFTFFIGLTQAIRDQDWTLASQQSQIIAQRITAASDALEGMPTLLSALTPQYNKQYLF